MISGSSRGIPPEPGSRERELYLAFGERLIAAFPELSEPYKAFLDWWGEGLPGPINVSDEILLPYIRERLEKGTISEMKRVFVFLEDLATDLESQFVETAQEIIDSLAHEEAFLKQRDLVGQNTRKLLERSGSIGS